MRARVIQLFIEFIKFFEKGQQLTYFNKISKTNVQHCYSQRKEVGFDLLRKPSSI